MSTKPTINIKVSTTKKGFTFCDNTGKFSKSNPKGWKPGDWSINHVTSATITLTAPNSATPMTTLLTTIPSLDCTCVELLPSMFGMSEFPSGKYKIQYKINMSSPVAGTVLSSIVNIYNLESIKCCIESKKKALCDLNDGKAVEVYFMDTLFDALTYAICEGDEETANTILAYLNNKCNCKCC